MKNVSLISIIRADPQPSACATHMIRNRANIRHVQEMLGHAKLDTTQKYLQLTITDLKEAHARCHPREKDA